MADAPEGFGTADEFVGSAGVPDLFSFDGILLVIEREVGFGDKLDVIQVMQRCLGSEIGGTAYNKRDVAEEEGFGPGVVGAVEVVPGVFGRSHKPEESDDDEVDGVDLHGSELLVVDGEFISHGLDDGDIGGVGSGGRRVLLGECCHEIRE